MATLRPNFREKFDRDRDFVMSRSLPVSGRSFDSGESFDKTLVTTRRLRQMFDARLIHFDPNPKAVSTRAQRVKSQRKRIRSERKEAASERTSLKRNRSK